MRGMLVKDFRMLWMQKQFFAVIVVLSVFLLFSGQAVSFIICYCTAMGMYLSLSMITYDEYENGYAFLFTLPVSRRGYVIEKYVFSVICTVVMCGLSATVCGIFEWIRQPELNVAELILTAVSGMFAMQGLFAVIVPFRLKFGAEKGRIVIMIVTVAIFGTIILTAQVGKMVPALQDALQRLDNVSGPALCAAVILAVLAVMGISVPVSIHIVEKKQF